MMNLHFTGNVKMGVKPWPCIFFLFYVFFSRAQSPVPYAQQKQFASHLLAQHLYGDCLLLLGDLEKNYTLSILQRDSLNELHGFCFEKSELPDSAAGRYARVSGNAPFYGCAQMGAALNYCLAENFNSASQTLDAFVPRDTQQQQLKDFYYASLLLLRSDLCAFDDFYAGHAPFGSVLTPAAGALKDYSVRLKKAEHKSAFVAGLMSAILPGSGKIYAGKVRQGIATFIPLTVMGLQAWEAYSKGGIKSPGFIVFGSLFSVFYIGNIWGSALSVSVHKRETEHEIYNEVVLSLRVGLERMQGGSR